MTTLQLRRPHVPQLADEQCGDTCDVRRGHGGTGGEKEGVRVRQKKPPAGAKPAGGGMKRERYFRAAAASMRPLPCCVVGRMLTAELVISARSFAGPTWPYLPTRSAARPATCGVAIEVPAAKKNVFTTPARTFPQLGTRSWPTPLGGTRSPPGAPTLTTDEP